MMSRFQPVPNESEKIQNETVNRKELLSLSRRFEPSHLSFALSSRRRQLNNPKSAEGALIRD